MIQRYRSIYPELLMLQALLILLAFFILLVLAFFRLVLRLLRRRVPRSRGLLLIDKVLFTSTVLVLLAFMYGLWIEPRWVEVRTVLLESDKIPPGNSPVRLVQISDTHSPSNLFLQRRLPDLISELNPDIIVFTGDAVNEPAGVRPFGEALRKLAAIAPTYVIRGNRDAVSEDADIFAGTGTRELRGKTAHVTVRGMPLALVGASRQEDWRKVYSSLRQVPEGAFTVYLGHSPDNIEDIDRWGADLYLAGHTHGGQVALPLYGAIWTASRFGKRYEAGLYREGGTWLYVNRGIGMEALLPKVRFLARPEITLIQLSPEIR